MAPGKWRKAGLGDIVWEVKLPFLIIFGAGAIWFLLRGVALTEIAALLALIFLSVLFARWWGNAFSIDWAVCPCGKTFATHNKTQCPKCEAKIPSNVFE